MPSTPLLTRLTDTFSEFQFAPSTEFRWSPDEATIYYETDSDDDPTLLHELSHAILAHKDYKKDIGLLELERDAWDYARTVLGPAYGVTVDETIIQDSLDTYRDWLHARSTCPECRATGLQVKQHDYRCVACGTIWRVNDARFCALRRYKTKDTR